MVDLFTLVPHQRDINFFALSITALILCKSTCGLSPSINYLAIYETSEDVKVKDGIISVEPEKPFKLWLFGNNLNGSLISLSETAKSKGESCDNDRTTKPEDVLSETGESAEVQLTLQVRWWIFGRSN